jgi:hypothetical protein
VIIIGARAIDDHELAIGSVGVCFRPEVTRAFEQVAGSRSVEQVIGVLLGDAVDPVVALGLVRCGIVVILELERASDGR